MIFVHNFCHNLGQTILHQFDHSPPPIWSLGFTWFVGFLFIFLIIFAANASVQNPNIMYCNIFGSGFCTHFSFGVNWASLVLSRFSFVLVLRGNAICAAVWPSRFPEKHICRRFWILSILKIMRGENCHLQWLSVWMARVLATYSVQVSAHTSPL